MVVLSVTDRKKNEASWYYVFLLRFIGHRHVQIHMFTSQRHDATTQDNRSQTDHSQVTDIFLKLDTFTNNQTSSY
jgi:hypothetical protein